MKNIKIATPMIALTLMLCALLMLGNAAHAKDLKTWWGTWNTDDYNHKEGTDPNDGTNPQDDLYPPSDEHGTPDLVTGRSRTLWVWKNAPKPIGSSKPKSTDPLGVYGVRGANRTVFTDKPTLWRRVSGQFNEPSLDAVDLTRKTNKATYYFGMTGGRTEAHDGLPAMTFYTDCGIAWENGGKGSNSDLDGWTLYSRSTVTIAGKGTWSLWKTIPDEDKKISATRYMRRGLGAITMTYDVSSSQGDISFGATNGLSGKINTIYGDPKYPVEGFSLRRNVGLTQDVSAEEFFGLKGDKQINERPVKSPIDRGNDPNAVVVSGVTAIYLDGSMIPSLLFSSGELSKPIVPSNPDLKSWAEVGGSDLLRPNQVKADDKWIIDFVAPVSKARPQDGSYKTDFENENVKITMGVKKHPHNVQVIPKGKK